MLNHDVPTKAHTHTHTVCLNKNWDNFFSSVSDQINNNNGQFKNVELHPIKWLQVFDERKHVVSVKPFEWRGCKNLHSRDTIIDCSIGLFDYRQNKKRKKKTRKSTTMYSHTRAQAWLLLQQTLSKNFKYFYNFLTIDCCIERFAFRLLPNSFCRWFGIEITFSNVPWPQRTLVWEMCVFMCYLP